MARTPMKTISKLLFLGLAGAVVSLATGRLKAQDGQGAAIPIFDGKSLNGWVDQENSNNQFGGGDFKDLDGFAKKLLAKADPVSAFLNDKLGETNKAALVEFLAANTNSVAAPGETNAAVVAKIKAARSMLSRQLTAIISDGPIYEKARFSGVQLRPETKELLAKNPHGIALLTLNKMLVEDADPTGLGKTALLEGWTVKDGAIASTGAGRGTLFTVRDYTHYRLQFLMRHVSGKPDHEACVLVLCRRPGGEQKLLDALGGVQFQVPNGGHWDYRPGFNNGGKSFSSPAKTKFDRSQWSQVEILVDGTRGIVRMAVAQPPGSQAVENLDFNDPSAGKVGPIALQMHNAGLFDEYKDITVEENPAVDDLITTK